MASIDVEMAACSASPVDFRIGCSGRDLKFRLDMHSISVGYRRPKALCASAARRSLIGHRGVPVQHSLEVKWQRSGEVNHHAGAGHEPILTPDIPAMIAAAKMALIATQTPQRRSALR